MEDFGVDDSAFTEDELSCGIRSIYGTSGNKPQRSTEAYNRAISELVEYESDVPLQTLCKDLVKNFVSNDQVEIKLEFTREADKVFGASEGELDLGVCITEPMREDEYRFYCVYLIFAHADYWVSIRDFLKALKQTQLPLSLWSNWFVWDADSDMAVQCRKILPGTKHSSNEPHDVYTARALAVVQRSLFTMDHGYKPMLIRREDLFSLSDRQPVELPYPAKLTEAEMQDYMLAFFASNGEIYHIPLLVALTETTYLATRGCTYSLSEGVLTPAQNQAWAVVSAYQMALRMINNLNLEVRSFHRKPQATVYEAVYRNIALDEVNDFPKAEVFLTDGNHPLQFSENYHDCVWGAGLVTTYELYDQARRNLLAHGFQCLDLNQKWSDLPDCGSGIVFE